MCTNELQYENGVYNLLYGVQFSNTYTCSSGDKSEGEGVCVCVEGGERKGKCRSACYRELWNIIIHAVYTTHVNITVWMGKIKNYKL